ncbi:hypothetical protein [Brucella pituitosa]|uniref:Uncharacterized protein n=1 Tax=Brucella pituitosa TaxID=571256 RepID=A0ABS3K4Z9_9HYPH|nr:hypothetical protein [Brucella pituitosa]MBO1041986.1 hypothetical protein [Brucella pituitosa]
MENLDDGDTYVFEPAVIKLTPYDRRLKELRDLQDRREELLTHPDSQRRIAELDYQIKKAEERFEREKKRSTDDSWRRRRDIDEWRSRGGKELRNASRRKMRNKPNENLSHLSPEQKLDRKRIQRSDANFVKRKRKARVPESDIQAALSNRQRQRETEKKTAGNLAHNPAYGAF